MIHSTEVLFSQTFSLPPAWRCCDRTCFSARSFVHYEKQKSDFHEIWHGCSASAPNVTVNFSAVKVKVQGQSGRTEYLLLVSSAVV